MQFAQAVLRRYLLIFLLTALATSVFAQAKAPDPSSVPGFDDMNKYPGLLDEFGRLITRFQQDVKFPPARSTSDLLPLLPESTNFYVAFPNYGDASHQLLAVFQEELQQNASLRDWWTHGDMAKQGPKFEDALNRFSQISEYLGDEIILSGAIEEKDPRLLIATEIRKPGLKPVLEQMLTELASHSKSRPGIRLLDPQELTTVSSGKDRDLLVLIRPDVLVVATDLATVRDFNSKLDHSAREFASTPFAQRILHSYNDGVTVLGAADLHTIIGRIPATKAPNAAIFQQSGFADMQYLVWEHKTVAGQSLSQAELSFTGPRHGIASWLGAPISPASLDFVSPKAIFAATLVLNHPAQIFDDVRELSSSNPMASAQLSQMEQALGISFRDDFFGQLGGELTVELDNAEPPQPAWKAILRVKDPRRFQQTLATIMNGMHLQADEYQEGGLTYHVFQAPAGKTATEVTYAFVDGYLVFGSTSALVEEAVRLHRFGGSLAKSTKFQAALPQGHRSGVSALFYQDPVAMTKFRLQMMAPALAKSYSQFAQQTAPTVVCFYGGERSITEASTSATADAGVVLIAAAVAIPNLLRSRVAANEAAAVGKLRTLNTAQVAYRSSYSDRGFASDLATLGPDPNSPNKVTADHAALIDASLGSSECTAGKWCENSGYRFSVTAVCGLGLCNNFVASATPVSPQTGSRSFCSVSDGTVRYRSGVVATPPKLHECRTWIPLK
jgi:hypothetical protein